MNLEKSVDHGEHSEHSGKKQLSAMFSGFILWVGKKMLKNSGISLPHRDLLRGMSPWFELRF